MAPWITGKLHRSNNHSNNNKEPAPEITNIIRHCSKHDLASIVIILVHGDNEPTQDPELRNSVIRRVLRQRGIPITKDRMTQIFTHLQQTHHPAYTTWGPQPFSKDDLSRKTLAIKDDMMPFYPLAIEAQLDTLTTTYAQQTTHLDTLLRTPAPKSKPKSSLFTKKKTPPASASEIAALRLSLTELEAKIPAMQKLWREKQEAYVVWDREQEENVNSQRNIWRATSDPSYICG